AIYMGNGERFTPDHMLNLHRSNATYIRQKLSETFDGRTIVLTHHMPHPECTPPIYANAPGNYLFACGADAFDDILHSELAPDLWICGHTHYAFDIQVGRSRIICNPHGYGWEQRRNGFRWDWVIDTDDIGGLNQCCSDGANTFRGTRQTKIVVDEGRCRTFSGRRVDRQWLLGIE